MDPKKILVVDCEKKILRAIERLFFEDRYETITALSAREGLLLLSNVMPVQVVVSGYRMPEMGGIEFLRQVHRRWPDIVRVIISGHEDVGDIVPAIDGGKIDTLIVKPWNNSELRNSIAHAMEIYELRTKNRELADKLDRGKSALDDLNKNMEEIIAEKAAELERIEKDLSQSERLASLETIARGIADEIKSPLESIMEEIEYVRTTSPLDARIVDGADRIKRASLRADNVIKGLLAFCRHLSFEKNVTNVTGLIEEVLSSMEHQIKLRHIKVVRKFYHGVTAMMIDGARMREMFINVLSNSVEAMPEGGAIIVRSRRLKDTVGKRYLHFTVADEGCGIPREEIRRVFDPFFTTGRSRGKTGLGLSIAKGIVEGHGGTIRIESRMGVGTKVFIRFPVEGENDNVH